MAEPVHELTYHRTPEPADGREPWDRDQRDVVRSVAHEVRSTLASISISAESLGDSEQLSPGQVHHHTRVIVEQARHIGRVLDDLVAVASDELNEGATSLVEVNEMVWEAAQQLWKLAEQRSIRLHITPSSTSEVIRGKSAYLTQAVRGCLEYGLLSLPEGSQVGVSIKSSLVPGSTGAVEILVEFLSSADAPSAPRATRSPAWDRVTLRAVRRIVEAHKGSVAALGDERDGLRVLLPRHAIAGAQRLPRFEGAESPSEDDCRKAVA